MPACPKTRLNYSDVRAKIQEQIYCLIYVMYQDGGKPKSSRKCKLYGSCPGSPVFIMPLGFPKLIWGSPNNYFGNPRWWSGDPVWFGTTYLRDTIFICCSEIIQEKTKIVSGRNIQQKMRLQKNLQTPQIVSTKKWIKSLYIYNIYISLCIYVYKHKHKKQRGYQSKTIENHNEKH